MVGGASTYLALIFRGSVFMLPSTLLAYFDHSLQVSEVSAPPPSEVPEVAGSSSAHGAAGCPGHLLCLRDQCEIERQIVVGWPTLRFEERARQLRCPAEHSVSQGVFIGGSSLTVLRWDADHGRHSRQWYHNRQ